MTYSATGLTSRHTAALAPIEDYLQGHATGNPEVMRRAFHADARIVSFRDGKLHALTVEDFIAARCPGHAPADEAQRRRAIAQFDVVGNAGVAKVVLEHPDVVFTDYMTLLQIDGAWKIVNKTFSAAPRPQQ
ncbi:nuclear transport factor 2 family protein [Cupriavidus oxalaticus]|uniref:3-hydroxyisobutyrate dehydrogenase MmsB n=1 Tax=Cupriavidus oxalaticus TaxID=96344 RepID=A0A375GNH9_9BURK|nr:nuclear transport factor 2 family protein [Cupriavidus oxalaticus]QRQ84767.1 nuclear transport factor 2 family protein [Cupriavidus oxalaticus]QRQ91144.1 nuclear transport factor 2 family protein [Cupriavidus oxalaticus]WQD85693.1 nuclear transport factor 2 family protein [Cupriavidus oxalaticus]SPC20797.1 3-hydroxyisobutyrate dehydrogenase MmsB [Cupriavidus oxalaticus]